MRLFYETNLKQADFHRENKHIDTEDVFQFINFEESI